MKTKSAAVPTALACALLAGTSSVRAADVTYERLRNPEPHNWLMHHRDYGAQHFSPLDAINKSNVKNLKLAFAVASEARRPMKTCWRRRWWTTALCT